MKLARQQGPIHSRGVTLIELLVYMAILVLVLELAYAAMYRSMDASATVRRNANDISQTLKMGELWRQDIRDTTRPVRLENDGQEVILHLPQQQEVDYRFATNSVSRRIGQGDWSVILNHVKNCAFVTDQREKVTAWRWEIELQPSRKALSRVRPLFTFIAVQSVSPAP